jgi:hypothetical protein
MNKNCTLKLVNEISLYYDARSKNIKIFLMFLSKAQDVSSVTHTHTNQIELPQLFRTKFPIAITTQLRVR